MPRSVDNGGQRRRRGLFDEAVAVIELSYDDERLSVDGLSREIYASPRQVQHAFAEAGTSVRDKVFEVRMERAAALLRASSLPVAVVATSVGYHQPAQFAKAFRRRYGRAVAVAQRRGPGANRTRLASCATAWRWAARSSTRASLSRAGGRRRGRWILDLAETLADQRLSALTAVVLVIAVVRGRAAANLGELARTEPRGR